MPEQFDGKPLDALYAMIAFARPGELTTTGEALAKAVPKLQEIARDLRHYIARVQWDGAAGDAFRLWGADMVTQTLLLGDYTNTAAAELKRAGQALAEAKSALPKPTGTCFEDPEKESARVAAETGPKLQEAIHQMERLSSYYGVARERLEAAKEPRFRPIVGSGVHEMERPYSTTGGGSGPPMTRSVGMPGSHPGPGGDPLWASTDHSYEADMPQVRTTLNSTNPAPDSQWESSATRLTAPPPQVPGDFRLAGLDAQSHPISSPTGAPRIAGRERLAGSSPAARAAGARTPGPRIPMGTIIGHEGLAPPSGALPSTPAGAGRRPPVPPNIPSLSARTAQTPAGAGLIPPMPTHSSAAERRSSAGRPAYLMEDEETWMVDQRHVVPPVID